MRISDRVGVAGDDFSWLGLEAYESLLLRAQGQSFHHSPVWAATYALLNMARPLLLPRGTVES